MILIDVNVLVYAFRRDAAGHADFRAWLEDTINADSAFGIAELALSGFLRVVTHPKVFARPSRIEDALAFAAALRQGDACRIVAPGERHWEIFDRLCRDHDVRGNLVPDAYFAALAIESGSEWITTDHDFSRFGGLRYRHPLR